MKPARALDSESINAVMDLLRTQGIPFRGPFNTPGKQIVFAVEDYVFLDSELIELYRQNRLHREGLQEFRRHRNG